MTAEAVVTAGYSTDEVAAVATQFRAFGQLKAGVQFHKEMLAYTGQFRGYGWVKPILSAGAPALPRALLNSPVHNPPASRYYKRGRKGGCHEG